jgi:phosphoribosylaminoimidazolecarboxamide formyltransferase/IMP cyclohydrolase
VKTLHPAIHGGILADPTDPGHVDDLDQEGIVPFQLVVVNLYRFEEAATAGAAMAEAVEQIDIGGPAMIRAAAKNHAAVGVVVSPERYDEVAAAVEVGGLPDELRLDLARDAFFRTAAYDAAIVNWLESTRRPLRRIALPLERRLDLRYGENPHQPAAVFAAPGATGWWSRAKQFQGKEMSFNNYHDTEAAWRLAADLASPAAVIVKHANACGAALGETLPGAFQSAWDCDPLSAFGSVIALNAPLDPETAAMIADRFVEVVITPEVEPGAAEVLRGRKNLRLLEAPPPRANDLDVRRIEDGFLVQRRDRLGASDDPPGTLAAGWEVQSSRAPSNSEVDDLRFAWTVAAHTKSNAIVVARGLAAVGVGAGDQSRVGATERALVRAGDRSRGAVAAGDAFFPFRDAIDLLAQHGVTAIVQPGGSIRDEEVVAAADDHGIAMVTTATRHFRH